MGYPKRILRKARDDPRRCLQGGDRRVIGLFKTNTDRVSQGRDSVTNRRDRGADVSSDHLSYGTRRPIGIWT
jgi:hypothetical protein